MVQIIYLNGPSSSGKTTLAKALQNALKEPYLLIGFDKIIGMMPEKVNNWTGGKAPLGFSWKKTKDEEGHLIHEIQTGPFAKKVVNAYKEIVLLLAKSSFHLIIDDVSFGKKEVNCWKKLLQDFKVLYVGLNAPLKIIEAREKKRSNRIPGSARAQHKKVHVDVDYDLELDTAQLTLKECVQKILIKTI